MQNHAAGKGWIVFAMIHNGRFARDYEIRVTAANPGMAARRAFDRIKAEHWPKRQRITAATFRVVRS